MDPKDQIVKFYKENDHLLNKEGAYTAEGHLTHRVKENPIVAQNAICVNQNPGLGDTLSLFHLPKHFKKNPKMNCFIGAAGYNMLFPTLSKFCPDYIEPTKDHGVKYVNQMELVQGHLKMGNGHTFQRQQRALGLNDIDIKPKPNLSTEAIKEDNKVILNFHGGACQEDQKKYIHPKARELYPEHRKTIQRFISNNKNKFHFVEVSKWSSDFEDVENKCGLPIAQSLKEVSTASWYLGLHTGMMHVAAAFDLKSIVILNFPNANRIYLPMIKDYEIVDKDWLYPQNIHLHEDEGGELVKLLSYETLDKAFAGDLYPFFSEKYLDLILDTDAVRVKTPKKTVDTEPIHLLGDPIPHTVAESGFLDRFFDGFQKQRHEAEHGKWTDVKDAVIKPLVNYDTLSKAVSDEFAGLYVHGGEKPFVFAEHYAPFLSFRAHSKFRYPIYLFYSDYSNQESDDDALKLKEIFSPLNIVPIQQLKGHNEYSKFMIREAFYQVSQEKILTFQDDGFLKKKGWEDFVDQFDFDYIGAPWPFSVNKQAGYGQVCLCPEKYGIPKDVKVSVGNGGFSFRKRSKMIEVAEKVNDEDCDWKYDGNQLPEDTFFSYFGFGMNIFKQVPEDIALRFSREPYHKAVDSFGFHRVL